jgi:hypothetical protein
MIIYYRISDTGYNKVKPNYINNEYCLSNFCKIFHKHVNNIHIIADNISDKTYNIITKYIDSNNIEKVSIGNGSGTFNHALTLSLKHNENEIIYFVENDYLHLPNSDQVIKEGFKLGVDYISLYDHPDKYMDHVNPFVEDGGEITRVLLSSSTHWKLTNSTTMTFASKVKTLREDEYIFRKHTQESCPKDFNLFLELNTKNRSLISPIPGYSTHGETAWLSPLIKWSNI